MIWTLRIAIARLLLGTGPEGFDFYFKDQKLSVRRQRGWAFDVGEPRIVLGSVEDLEERIYE